MKVVCYGLWLIPKPIKFNHRDLYRETRFGYSASTNFQRAVGVRYSNGQHSSMPDSKGGFVGFGPSGAPPSVSKLLKGFFVPGPLPRSKVHLFSGHRSKLAKASGYVILSAPHLRMRSVQGRAHLIGCIRVKSSANT